MNASEACAAPRPWPGLGLWNLYFLGKFALLWVGALNFQLLPNLLLAAVLLLPLPRWAARLRTLLAIPAAVALLYHDSWLPPFSRLLAQPGVLDFSPEYLLELAGRFVDWQWLGAGLLLVLGYALLAPWLRLTTLSLGGLLLLSLQAVPLPVGLVQAAAPTAAPVAGGGAPTPAAPAGEPDSATLEAWLSDFHRREAERRVSFAANAAAPPFDLLVLNVCSLSWDDLEAVGLRDHRLFARLDILFDNFNSATSYSGPAAIRLLRASCGQTSHAGLYQPAGEQCLLFDNLGRLGFAQQLAFNHNGRFDGFLDEVRGQGDLPEPLFAASSFGRALVAFDTSPIAADGEVLGRWWQQRQDNAAERLALFYNSITLHDGNRVVEANGGTRSAGYRERAQRLLDDLDAFLDQLERSGRPVVVVLVPEHGAALHGDRMQISGMREYPSRAITHVPVGVKLIGLPLAEGPLQRIGAPSSYLALSELVARLHAGPPAGQAHFTREALLADLPQIDWVAESAGGVVVEYAGRDYLRTREGGPWQPYPQRAQPEVAHARQ